MKKNGNKTCNNIFEELEYDTNGGFAMENILANKSNRKITDLTGKKFGRLTVIKFVRELKRQVKIKKYIINIIGKQMWLW